MSCLVCDRDQLQAKYPSVSFSTICSPFVYFLHFLNLTDDNTLSSAAKTMDTVLFLNQERNGGIDWLDENEMIVNPVKFQAIQ